MVGGSSISTRRRRGTTAGRAAACLATLWLLGSLAAASGAPPGTGLPLPANDPIERGFRLLYDLDFAGAQKLFAAYQQAHPDDPMGPAAEAAGLLFTEFNRLGVLETQFLTDDEAFLARSKLAPNASLRSRFNAALQRTETLAAARLARNPADANALFALTLAGGLRADYAAMIENRNLAALSYARQSSQWADKLLAAQPDCPDACLATGMSKYLVGSLVAPLRWVLRLGGYVGDKEKGLAELALTANRGRLLAPFARILLAVAWLRDNDKARARELLSGLQREFPHNPLFGLEIERIDKAAK